MTAAARRDRDPTAPRPASRPRGRALVVAVVCVVVAGVCGLASWSFFLRAEHPSPPGEAVQVEIKAGVTTADIAHQLASRGVIANASAMRLMVRLKQADGDLRPGVYDLTTGMGYDSVIDVLRAGPVIEYMTITVPEGWTLDQVAQRVQERTGIPATDFSRLAHTGAKRFSFGFLESNPTDSLEGYLFPKTYRIRVGSDAEDVMRAMLAQFEKETADLDLAYAASKQVSPHDVVTIASMIERETKVQSDRPLVSSVIYNRLGRNMYLEIDATVQYVLGGRPRLFYRDLRVNSPYNTYRYRGLPPGPIASPGLASLKAAASPADTDYLYYVLTHKDGTHTFATTKAEFERLKARAKRGLK